MRFLLTLVLLIITTSLASGQQLKATTILACETQAQVERFIALDANGSALDTVNAEADNPDACAAFKVAFILGPEVSRIRRNNLTYIVFEVKVLGPVKPGYINITSGKWPIFYTLGVDGLRV